VPQQWKESIILPIYEKGEKTDCTNQGISVTKYIQNFIQHSSLNVNSICRQNYSRSSLWILMEWCLIKYRSLHGMVLR
jgi:hypothetical protein